VVIRQSGCETEDQFPGKPVLKKETRVNRICSAMIKNVMMFEQVLKNTCLPLQTYCK